MMRNSQMGAATPEQQLTALADGTLRGTRRWKAEARLAERPDLLASLERQREVIALLRGMTPGTPPKLWTRIEEQRRRSGTYLRRRFP